MKKFYDEFKSAEAVHDTKKMSELIAAVNEICKNLAQVGRANEISQEALYIVKHANVLIYQVLKFLSDGQASAAKNLLLGFFRGEFASFDRFFYLLYVLGKIFYAEGDYIRAIKVFTRYELLRDKNWHDTDELSIFYRANCAALIGDFDAAIKFYEQILTIKADFPEVKNNLSQVLLGTNKNLQREVQSLWNFPNWCDVPIFINARDRLGVMKKLIDWLLAAGYRNLIILDNASTYPPLLKYYSELERDLRIKIIRLGKNFGFKAIWLSNILERLKISTPYVYTDPDVLPIERCPKNFIKRLMKILESNREVRKVGLGLVFDDITFFDSESARKLEALHYDGKKIGNNLYFSHVDTTFALYSNVRHYSLRFSLRTAGGFMAYHLPWYFDYDNLPEDEKYYLEHADKSASLAEKFRNRN